MSKALAAFLFISLISFVTRAQSDFTTEKSILLSFKKLDKYSLRNAKNDIDYEKLNNEAREQLLNYLITHNLSMEFLYQLKREKVTVVRSVDGRLTIFSWSTIKDDYRGLFTSIIQYCYKNFISAKLLFDASNSSTDNPGQRYSKIYTLKSKALGIIYLAKYDETYSNVGSGQGVKAFQFRKSKIRDSVKIFTNGNTLGNDLNIGYNTFEYSNIGSPQIRFDSLTNTLYVPKITLSGSIKKGYNRYRFNGKMFVMS